MKTLLVDDHPLVREAIALLLQDLDPKIEVIQAGNGTEALERFEAAAGIRLVLVDLVMPDMDGFDLLAELSGRNAECTLVVISATEDRRAVARTHANGADGFIHKSWSSERMQDALKCILDGGSCWPNELDHAFDERPELTRRQRDILQQLALGQANRQIAEALHISEHTVKFHLATLFRLLDASNRTECVAQARAAGLLP